MSELCGPSGGGGRNPTDVVERAKAAGDKLREACAASDDVVGLRLVLAIEDLAEVVPELVAEIEKLRSALIDGAVEQYKIDKGLAAAGWVAVKLPEPLDEPDGDGLLRFPENVSTCYGRVWDTDCDLDPDAAVALAASLLAAANAAEVAR